MGDLTPITREEYYLARMAGEDVTMPEPITREEEYMKGIAAQIEAGSAELPAVTDVDEGKILAVNASGKWDKADAPTELPEVTSDDNGDVLTVVEGAWTKADAPTELPAVTANDWGRVLAVNSSGEWTKSAPKLILDSKFTENDIGTTSKTIYTAENPSKFFASVLLIVINNALSDKYVGIAMPGTSPGTFDVVKLADGSGKNISLKIVMSLGPTSSFTITGQTDDNIVTGARISIYKLSD